MAGALIMIFVLVIAIVMVVLAVIQIYTGTDVRTLLSPLSPLSGVA